MHLWLSIVTLVAVVAVLDAGGYCPGTWKYRTGRCNYETCQRKVYSARCKKTRGCHGRPKCSDVKKEYLPCTYKDQKKCSYGCSCYYKYYGGYYGKCYNDNKGKCVIKKKRHCYCKPDGCGHCDDKGYWETADCPYGYGHDYYDCKHDCDCKWKYHYGQYSGSCYMHNYKCVIKVKRTCDCPYGCDGHCDEHEPHKYVDCPYGHKDCY